MRTLSHIAAWALVLTLTSVTARAQEDPRPDQGITWKDLFDTSTSLRLYGFLRTDAAYDSARFNDPQIPIFVLSPESDPNNTHDEFSLYTRMTRFGMELASGEIDGLGEPGLDGKLEIDFFNIVLGDSDSREAIRMRLAYLNLQWERWGLLVGQDWDVVSPLRPSINDSITMWGAGNTGDRRPQITATYAAPVSESSRLVTKFGIALPGAVGGALTSGGLSSGEASGRPLLHARVGYHGDARGGGYQVGVWGHSSQERFDATGTGEQNFNSYSLGVDVKAPLGESGFGLAGEYFTGSDLRDIRGGILQGVNTTTGSEIAAQGGWLELTYTASSTLSLYAGYSIDDPTNADLEGGDRARNSVPYLAARWRFSDLRIGLEYMHWTTDYVGLESGRARRLAAWIAYYF